MTKPLFTKKSLKPAEEGVQESPVQEERENPAHDDDANETVRLSCDLLRSRHLALRVAAAHCERTIVDMVVALIEKHLVDAKIEDIIKAYHRKHLAIRIK